MSRSAPGSAIAIVCAALLAPVGLASQDGPEWETAASAEGCLMCHLSDAAAIESPALQLAGLPQAPESGREYSLTITLEDPALQNAGFLLSILGEGTQTGALMTDSDERIEIQGVQARSTWAGSFVAESGRAQWQLTWIAPETLDGALRFELWANAGNYDLSPIGDRIYHGTWTIAVL